MERVMVRFSGLERWGGDGYLIEMPRVPMRGEVIAGPDDFGAWVVVGVVFDYADGLAFEPTVQIDLEPEPGQPG